MRKYLKGILIPMAIAAISCFVGIVDGGAECGAYPETRTATVTVTLEDGNQYVMETEVTVLTYGSKDPEDWEIDW